MTEDEITAACAARAGALAGILGTVVTSEDPDRIVIETWADTVPGRIPDVGSGTGRWSGHLASLGHEVEGLEPVAAFVELASRNHPGVAFRRAATGDLEGSPERWAGLLVWYSLIHLDLAELSHALATLRGVLVEGGSILISFFAGRQEEAFAHPATIAGSGPVPVPG